MVKAGYKQTEIGEIPIDWDAKPLGDVVNFTNGKAHENDISDNGRYIVVNSKFISTEGEVKKYSDKCYCATSKSNILMVMSDVPNGRAIAKCFYVDQNDTYTVNQRICSIDVTQAIPKYIFYQLNRNPYYLSFDDGVKQTNLRKSDVLSCPLSIPENKEEQRAIAEALSDVDALIAGLDKLIAKKRAVKTGTMQVLLTGEKRLPGFGDDRNGRWETTPLPTVCWFQEGPGVRKYQFTKSGVKLLNGTNIFRGNIDLDKTDKYVSLDEAYGMYSHFLAEEGDIVIASSGVTIEKFDEKIAFVHNEHLPLCMNTSTIRFKSFPEKLDQRFLYQYLMSANFKKQIGGQATGSAQLNFGPSHISKVEVDLPDIKEQQAIATILSAMDAELTALETRRAKTQAIKQGMMQELLTGRTRLL